MEFVESSLFVAKTRVIASEEQASTMVSLHRRSCSRQKPHLDKDGAFPTKTDSTGTGSKSCLSFWGVNRKGRKGSSVDDFAGYCGDSAFIRSSINLQIGTTSAKKRTKEERVRQLQCWMKAQDDNNIAERVVLDGAETKSDHQPLMDDMEDFNFANFAEFADDITSPTQEISFRSSTPLSEKNSISTKGSLRNPTFKERNYQDGVDQNQDVSFRYWYDNRASEMQQHRAATTIQRIVRGYMTSLRFFDCIHHVTTIIQSVFRCWPDRRRFLEQRRGSVRLQAVFRGIRDRESLSRRHKSAREIQRVFRGYLSTVDVYLDIYYITKVQSIVRKKIALELAVDRMVWIMLLQALGRGYLVRRQNLLTPIRVRSLLDSDLDDSDLEDSDLNSEVARLGSWSTKRLV